MAELSAPDLLLKITLMLITFSLGLGVSPTQVADVFVRPRKLVIGLISQMVFLPLLALVICWFAPLPNSFKLGIFIISLCPGGTTANLISYLLRANVALSISLTAVNGLLCIVSIPLLAGKGVEWFHSHEMSLSFPYWQTFIELLSIILLPGNAGVLLNRIFPHIASALDRYIRFLLPLGLGLVFGIKIFGNQQQGGVGLNADDVLNLLPWLLLLNIASILGGYLLGSLNRIRTQNSLTIAIETGIQNTGLALLICSSTGYAAIQKPVVLYASFSFVSTLLIAYLLLLRAKKNARH